MDMRKKVAEIIESSSTEFLAQCYDLEAAPALGTLVEVQSNSIKLYGVVCEVLTHSIEPGRRIVARGLDVESEVEVFRRSPQLVKLLTTDFKVLLTGYRQEDSIFHYLPPKPAPIHGFVYVCESEEIKNFSQSLNFLNLLIDVGSSISEDDVIAASIRHASSVQEDPEVFLIKAGRELVTLLGSNTFRLNAILKRLK